MCFINKIAAKLMKKPQICHKNEEKSTFFAFFLQNIWSVQKKAVPLHPLSDESDVLKHFAAIAQLVEHNLAKVGVASSSLVCRSIE